MVSTFIDEIFNDLFFSFPENYSKPPIFNFALYGDKKTIRPSGPVTAWCIQFALCGFKKNQVWVEYGDNILTVRGDNLTAAEEDPACKISSKLLNSFTKKFRVSSKFDIDSCEVSFEDGLLTIILPLKEQSYGKNQKILFGKQLE